MGSQWIPDNISIAYLPNLGKVIVRLYIRKEVSDSIINDILNQIKDIATKYQVSSSQVALRWALEEPRISSVITGIKNISQLEDNVASLDWKYDDVDYSFFKRSQ